MNDITTPLTEQEYYDQIWNTFLKRQEAGLEQIFTNDKRPATRDWEIRPMSQRDARAEYEFARSRVGTTPTGRGARYGVYGDVGLGIPLGLNNLITIDLDPRNFKPAMGIDIDFFQDLLNGGWENWLGKAYVEHTPTGGLHLIFRKPLNWEPDRQGVAKLKECGVDYLMDKHQVVVAPTVRADGFYSAELGEGCLDLHEFKSLSDLPDVFISKVPTSPRAAIYKPFKDMTETEQATLVRNVLSITPQAVVDTEASWVNTAFALGTWRHPEAFEVFDTWSKRSDKYEVEAAKELWYRVSSEEAVSKPNGRKLSHLFYEAAVNEWGDKLFKKSHAKALFPREKSEEQLASEECEWSSENSLPQVIKLIQMEREAGRYWIRTGPDQLKLFEADSGKGFCIVANDKASYETTLNKIGWSHGMHTVSDKRAPRAALEHEMDSWWKSFCKGDSSYNALPKDTWISYEAGCEFVKRNNLGAMPIDGADHVWVQSKTGLLNCTLKQIFPFNPYFIPNSELLVDFVPTAPDADEFLLSWIKLWAHNDEIAEKYLEVKREFLASAFLGVAVKACEFFYGETNIGKTGFYAVVMNQLFGRNSYQIMTREEFLGERWPSDILGKRVVIVDEVLGARHTDEMVVSSIKNKVTNEPVVSLNLKYAGHLRAAFTPTWVFTFNRYSKFFLDAAIEERAILVEGMTLKDEEGERDETETKGDTRVAHFFGQIQKDPMLRSMILNSVLKAKAFHKSDSRDEHLTQVMSDARASVLGQRSVLISDESPLSTFIKDWFTAGDTFDFVDNARFYQIYLEYLKVKESSLTRSHLDDLRRYGKSHLTFAKQLVITLKNCEWDSVCKTTVRGGDRTQRGWRGIRLNSEGLMNAGHSPIDETLTDIRGLTN